LVHAASPNFPMSDLSLKNGVCTAPEVK
jgi:hypothetical protein